MLQPPVDFPSKPGSSRVFAAIVFCTYLLPAVTFPLILRLVPHAAPLTKYLLTASVSTIWLLLGWWGLRSMGSSLAAVGLTRAKLVSAAAITLLVWGIYALLLIPMVLSAGENLEQVFQTSLATIFQQWLFVGLFEEILMRGYLLNWLRGRLRFAHPWQSDLAAVVATNLIFATMHIPQRLYQVAQGQMALTFILTSLGLVFLGGVAMSLIYLGSRGNLFLAGMVHGSGNAPLIGPSGDMLPLILFVLVIGVMALFRRPQSPEPVEAQAA